jgi:hypothetical protein
VVEVAHFVPEPNITPEALSLSLTPNEPPINKRIDKNKEKGIQSAFHDLRQSVKRIVSRRK